MNISQSVKAIVKLNRQTKEGAIKWEIIRGEPSSISGKENLMDKVYRTHVVGRWLQLYKYEYRYYIEEDHFEWSEGYRLEFIDPWGKSEWTFPDDRAIYDLYESVRYQTSNIEGFIDSFLTDEEKQEKGDDLPF